MPKIIFDEFFYYDSTSNINFGVKPSGQVDVSRLINNKPAWIQSEPLIEKKKKHLVIIDELLPNYSFSKLDQIFIKIKELQTAGFAIYFSVNSDIKLIPEEEDLWLNLLSYKGKTDKSSTIKALTNRNLPIDAVLMLDTYWIQCLIEGEKVKELKISSSSLLDKSGFDSKKTQKIFKDNIGRAVFYSDSFTRDAIHTLLDCKNYFPSIDIKTHYSFAVFSITELRELINHKGHLEIEGERFQYRDLHSLKELYLINSENSPIKHDDFILIDKELPNVQFLGINFKNLKIKGKPQKINFIENLMYLKIQHFSCEMAIKYFLESAINLKYLQLFKCQIIPFNKGSISFPRLKSIIIKYCQFGSDFLSSILTGATRLSVLKIKSGKYQNDFFKLQNELNNVHELKIEKLSISSDIIFEMLKNMPNIYNLYLSDIKFINAYEKLPVLCLKKLKNIKLHFLKSLTSTLNSLLLGAPNIRSLKLYDFEFLDTNIAMSLPEFSLLEILNVEYSNIDSKNLNIILNQSPRLLRLYLNQCENIKRGVSIHSSLHAKLESIIGRRCTLTLEELSKAPNLRELAVEDIGGSLNIGVNINNIESLSVDINTTNYPRIEKIINESKILKKLEIKFENDFKLGKQIEINTLFYLSDLTIHDSDGEQVDIVYQLFINSPNIVRLDISVESNIIESIYSRLTSRKHKSLNLKEYRLYYYGGSLSVNFAESLSSVSPNIEYLNIGNANIEKCIDVYFKPCFFKRLNKLSIYHSQVTSNILTISNYVELKIVKFRNCKFISDISDKKFHIVDNYTIEELEIYYSDLNTFPLERVLSQLKALSYLKIYANDKILISFNIQKQVLHQLKHIDLFQSPISADSLSSLLRATPNLEYLEFKTLPGGKLHLPENSLRNLKQIKQPHNLSDHNLLILLGAAPQLAHQILRVDYSSDFSTQVLRSLDLKTVPKRAYGSCLFSITSQSADRFETNKRSGKQIQIIEKLRMYATFNEQYLDVVAKVSDGICLALSFFFKLNIMPTFTKILESIQNWDGSVETLNRQLVRFIEVVFGYIDVYQIHISRVTFKFIGRDLMTHLSLLSNEQSIVLTNPWHAISIKRTFTGSYIFYDPNDEKVEYIFDAHSLVKLVNERMGPQIMVAMPERAILDYVIDDPITFINEAGILSLSMCANFAFESYVSINQAIPSMTISDLDCLFFMSNLKRPAWLIGSKSPNPNLKQLTLNMLARFKAFYGEKYDEILLSSLKYLNTCPDIPLLEGEKSEITYKDKFDASAKLLKFQNALTTWEVSNKDQKDPIKLIESLVQTTILQPTSLILVKSEDASMSVIKLLIKTMELNNQPYFYASSPEDLICSAPVAIQKEKSIHFEKSPSGALYEFIQKNKASKIAPVFLIDYSMFQAEDIVKFNSIIEPENPSCDGVYLPQNSIVIGIIDISKEDTYQGEDFYSRFKSKYDMSSYEKTLCEYGPRPLLSQNKSMARKGSITINLYNSTDWKSQLFGQVVLSDRDIVFKKGSLVNIIEGRRNIIIQNPPVTDKDFFQTLEQLYLGKGVYHLGHWYSLTEDQYFDFKYGYNWKYANNVINIHIGFHQSTDISLSPYTLPILLGDYSIRKKGSGLIKRKGLLSKVERGTCLNLNVTHPISDDSWAKLIDICHKRKISIDAHFNSEMDLPECFDKLNIGDRVELPLFNLDATKFKEFGIIQTTDQDITLRKVKERIKESCVVFVDSLKPEDLFSNLHIHFDPTQLKISASKKDGFLENKLEEGREILLVGNFSMALAQAISYYVLSKSYQVPITLITEDIQYFSCFSEVTFVDETGYKEKFKYIVGDDIKKITDEHVSENSIVRIEAMMLYNRFFPTADINDAFKGLDKIETNPYQNTCFDVPDDFHKKRLDSVIGYLEISPYIYISGITGVGKTTFIKKYFLENSSFNSFVGEDQITQWAKANGQTKPLLFIDEVNLVNVNWSFLEGLFYEPRGIFFEGQYLSVSKDHKVIFSGNPLNHGGERREDQFFKRHGNILVFDELPASVIFSDIILPLFAGFKIPAKDIKSYCEPLLNHYASASITDDGQVSITAREIQMAILLSMRDIAIKRSIEFTSGLFIDGFPRSEITQDNTISIENFDDSFVVTESREHILFLLQKLFHLRAWRRQEQALNEQQLYGGLGGLVLEGESGCGKTSLILQALQAHGFRESHSDTMYCYIKIPASTSLDKKRQLLFKAFDDGALVVMDEINSSPMIEADLNALLMGLHPVTHERPLKPGFFLIGTQNPIHFAGRKSTSSALKRRLVTLNIPEYSKEELMKILRSQTKLGMDDISILVSAYFERKFYAMNNRLSPAPCFRDLLFFAQNKKKDSME